MTIENRTDLLRITSREPSVSTKTRDKAAIASDSFNNLLIDYINNSKITPSNQLVNLPLDKKQIDILINIVQIKMHRQLLAVFLKNEAEIDSLSSNFKHNLSDTDFLNRQKASNNCQEVPKNNDYFKEGKLEAIVHKAAEKFSVDSKLISSVIRAESDFNNKATSAKGAMGLMQLMPETAKDLGVKNAYDPEENIMGGTRYLKMLLNRYENNVNLALAAYNWGMGNLEKNPDNLPEETSKYISRINRYLTDYKKSA